MTTIAIKLDPSQLPNPDADLRYAIPDRIQEATEGRVKDDGYDYLPDQTMVIFLAASSADDVAAVVDLLSRESFLDNSLLDAAVVGVDSGDGYTVVHPEDYSGEFDTGEG